LEGSGQGTTRTAALKRLRIALRAVLRKRQEDYSHSSFKRHRSVLRANLICKSFRKELYAVYRRWYNGCAVDSFQREGGADVDGKPNFDS
jgi:hypothetical protein